MAETSVDKKHERSLRAWSRVLSLWHLCGNAACTRAGACRGDVRRCGPRTFALLPEGVQGWFACLLLAKEEGLSFDEALRRIDETPAAQAFHDWSAAVDAAIPSARTDRASAVPTEVQDEQWVSEPRKAAAVRRQRLRRSSIA